MMQVPAKLWVSNCQSAKLNIIVKQADALKCLLAECIRSWYPNSSDARAGSCATTVAMKIFQASSQVEKECILGE